MSVENVLEGYPQGACRVTDVLVIAHTDGPCPRQGATRHRQGLSHGLRKYLSWKNNSNFDKNISSGKII